MLTAVNAGLAVPTTEIGRRYMELIEQYWRQGATMRQAIQAAKEGIGSKNEYKIGGS